MIFSPVTTTLLGILVAAAPVIVPHPHHPRAIKVGGAGGMVTVTYFTVPYNPEQLKGLENGFEWHLGFAMLETEVPLMVGDVAVPAGKHKLQGRLNGDGTWDLVLRDAELVSAESNVFFSKMRGAKDQVTAAEAKLQEVKAKLAANGGEKEYALAADDFAAADEEHLLMNVLLGGYATKQRFSTEAAGGVEFALQISYGDLHRTVGVREVFGEQKDR